MSYGSALPGRNSKSPFLAIPKTEQVDSWLDSMNSARSSDQRKNLLKKESMNADISGPQDPGDLHSTTRIQTNISRYRDIKTYSSSSQSQKHSSSPSRHDQADQTGSDEKLNVAEFAPEMDTLSSLSSSMLIEDNEYENGRRYHGYRSGGKGGSPVASNRKKSY